MLEFSSWTKTEEHQPNTLQRKGAAFIWVHISKTVGRVSVTHLRLWTHWQVPDKHFKNFSILRIKNNVHTFIFQSVLLYKRTIILVTLDVFYYFCSIYILDYKYVSRHT